MERERASRGGKLVTLRRSRDFDEAFRQGTRFKSDILLVICLQKQDGGPRVAFLTAKGVGNAVRRNRQRRRLREAYRALAPGIAGQPVDLLIMALPACAGADFTKLKATMARLLARADLLPRGGAPGREAAS